MTRQVFSGILLVVVVLIFTSESFAGRATAPYVKGELLIALKETTKIDFHPSKIVYGKQHSFKSLKRSVYYQMKTRTKRYSRLYQK